MKKNCSYRYGHNLSRFDTEDFQSLGTDLDRCPSKSSCHFCRILYQEQILKNLNFMWDKFSMELLDFGPNYKSKKGLVWKVNVTHLFKNPVFWMSTNCVVLFEERVSQNKLIRFSLKKKKVCMVWGGGNRVNPKFI